MMEEAQHSTEEGFGVVVNLAGLSIANVHLAPGPDGAPMRKAMLEQIAKVDGPLAVIGDTNMRMAEWEDLGDLAAAKPPTPTWDSRRNRFNAEIPEFSAYFTNVITRSGSGGRSRRVHTAPSASGSPILPIRSLSTRRAAGVLIF